MQTFLPYSSFEQTARCLDYRRLCKQRVEARQIFQTLMEGGAWSNHPAVKMWRGYKPALIDYSNCMIREWIARGYKNNMELWDWFLVVPIPPWLGDERLHSSHRANLLRKDPKHYGQFGWTEEPTKGYFWPVE